MMDATTDAADKHGSNSRCSDHVGAVAQSANRSAITKLGLIGLVKMLS